MQVPTNHPAMGARPAWFAWFVWALALGVPACTGRDTAIVVLVESDLSPSEVSSVHAAVGGAACGDARCAEDFPITAEAPFPFSFVIRPGGSAARVLLSLEARSPDGAVVVRQDRETAFVAGRTLLLRVRLDRACIGVACDGASETCSDGVCVARLVDPSALPDVVPGAELEAGVRDAGLDGSRDGSLDDADGDADARDDAGDADTDAGDAGRMDAGDAGRVVARCADLPGLAPSGPTLLDPDGPGGEPAFEGWCENVGDDGGWTLLAKVEPGSARLGFDAIEWLASEPAPFGTIDEATGDALLESYWRIPITQLRIGDGAGWIVTSLDAPVSSLRAAMAAHASLDATQATWNSIVNVSPIGSPPCVRSGLSVTIPSAIAPELRVRIGLAASRASDCGEPTIWYGLGVDVATSDSSCVPTTHTSGGARVCGSPGQRRSVATRLLVYGR